MDPDTNERQKARDARANEGPIVGRLPDFPGILATMMLSPDLAKSLRAIADTLLVNEYTGATVTRAERELIATAVSAGNDCFYCMDTHGAFASALMQLDGSSPAQANHLVENIKAGNRAQVSEKMQLLLEIASIVREHGLKLQRDLVERAITAGAADADVQLTILIASAFCMYNRMVDGFRARTPSDVAAHGPRAEQIARLGYADARVTAIPIAVSTDCRTARRL